jgi:hypothetical protein
MKSIKIFTVTTAILLCACAQLSAVAESALPFSEGEELIYDIYYKRMKLGRSKLKFNGRKNVEDMDLYHITFYTDVPGFEDTEEIYAHKDTFLPFRISRKIKRIGCLPQKIEEVYDQEAFSVTIDDKGNIFTRPQTIQKECPIYNPLLLTYYYRTISREESSRKKSVSLPKTDFDIVPKGREKVSSGLGESMAYVFSGEPSKFTFWLSDDDKKIPMKISGHNVFGYSFVLNSVEEGFGPHEEDKE